MTINGICNTTDVHYLGYLCCHGNLAAYSKAVIEVQRCE